MKKRTLLNVRSEEAVLLSSFSLVFVLSLDSVYRETEEWVITVATNERGEDSEGKEERRNHGTKVKS